MFRFIATLILAAFAFAAHAAVDVNKATQAELETVKGIGPKLSDKILAERQKGEFKDWSDMVVRVGGIGTGNAARFSPWTCCSSPTRWKPSRPTRTRPSR
jgi:competence protein ComEA